MDVDKIKSAAREFLTRGDYFRYLPTDEDKRELIICAMGAFACEYARTVIDELRNGK